MVGFIAGIISINGMNTEDFGDQDENNYHVRFFIGTHVINLFADGSCVDSTYDDRRVL